MSDKVTRVHAAIANHCGEIADLFEHGVRITVLVRNPSREDADVLVTDDSIDLAIVALGKLKNKEERKLTPADVLHSA